MLLDIMTINMNLLKMNLQIGAKGYQILMVYFYFYNLDYTFEIFGIAPHKSGDKQYGYCSQGSIFKRMIK